MHKRFWIICSVVAAALLILSLLGVSSLHMHEKGLRAERQQEFIAVAEQVRLDVKRRISNFLQEEQNRAYTDYQYYYVPLASNQTAALVRSPLANSFSNELALGYFQLDNTGFISTPYAESKQDATGEVKEYFSNINMNLLPSLQKGESLEFARVESDGWNVADEVKEDQRGRALGIGRLKTVEFGKEEQIIVDEKRNDKKKAISRKGTYSIDLEKSQQVQQQTVVSNRANVELNEQRDRSSSQIRRSVSPRKSAESPSSVESSQYGFDQDADWQREQENAIQDADVISDNVWLNGNQSTLSETVQVRIEPFVPTIVPEENGENGIFKGQVFLLRHVQVEEKHMVQGFKLNETELLNQIRESVNQFLRRGMKYDISNAEREDAEYTAVLDFGFGEIVLNLMEIDRGWVQARVAQIRNWFLGILAIVWLAVVIALAAFWRNLNEQIQLSRKKDDFISAVSHELRTPLTSIRMYTEMLEKDWVKTDEKRKEYYVTMRQESERLSRLIENVLDFSRIQRGKKQYEFTSGDVNDCIGDVVQMMQPYAAKAGFEIVQELGEIEEFTFDRDAVVQIVINLVDNAIKYAKDAQEKRIVVRTRKHRNYALIEVEDRGPGIAHNQQGKIFDAFYRCGDESTRQTTGTGLGLALVKRFAEAHRGFVEILNVKPNGALFRVALEI